MGEYGLGKALENFKTFALVGGVSSQVCGVSQVQAFQGCQGLLGTLNLKP